MSEPCPQTSAVIQRGIAEGLHLGAQLYAARGGQVVADMAWGESRPGEGMTPDTINLWMSSVKPVAAVAVTQLWQRGLLDLDDRVAAHIPEFAARGKEAITIRHLLTHTAGFRAAIGLEPHDSYEDAVATICEATLEPRWVPGRNAGYHASTSWYILAELVRRLDGRRFDRYAREAIFTPLGMNDSWVGMPPEAYRGYGRRIGWMYDTSRDDARPAAHANGEEEAALLRPGANGRGPIRELGRFYEMLRRKGAAPAGPSVLSPQTVEAMAARHRAGLYDLTFKHVLDWGLGFIINSEQYGDTVPYSFGPHASRRCFGHSGHQSSCALCDPDHGLVLAWVCNGMPGEPRHAVRQRQINAAVYQDLRLA